MTKEHKSETLFRTEVVPQRHVGGFLSHSFSRLWYDLRIAPVCGAICWAFNGGHFVLHFHFNF